jgi:uroporphyrin-III C-methyltransferase/precorrin-2 dehydrogenase/sirohydrochlorin ferrochelatase
VLHRRAYRRGDLAGCRLAYAATPDPDVNRAARDEAQALGIWFNAVDQPDLCDFITPAIVRRGDLTLAVSTNGRYPALAKQIRQQLEHTFGPECAEMVERMGETRDLERTEPGETESPAAGIVYLVGAGPGAPDLLTVKGRRLLACADTVVYDALVEPRLLDLCRPSSTRVYVGKRAGCHARSQDEINAILIDEARAGRIVVRLKGGDPFVFGRGGEEAEALVAGGLRFEVVPGVSAGVAVPAYAGIPLTHRAISGEVVFVTGHDSAESVAPVDWTRHAASPATLVVFMGLEHLGEIAARLMEHGRPPDCPVAVIANGTTAEQRTVVASLATVAAAAAAAGLTAPALIVVGEVVALRQRLQWFEPSRPSGTPPIEA